jgi:hypothetical protein
MRELGIQCTKCLVVWEKWMDDPVLDVLGSDYDENGVPYWEKWEDEGGPVKDIEERLKYMEDNGI